VAGTQRPRSAPLDIAMRRHETVKTDIQVRRGHLRSTSVDRKDSRGTYRRGRPVRTPSSQVVTREMADASSVRRSKSSTRHHYVEEEYVIVEETITRQMRKGHFSEIVRVARRVVPSKKEGSGPSHSIPPPLELKPIEQTTDRSREGKYDWVEPIFTDVQNLEEILDDPTALAVRAGRYAHQNQWPASRSNSPYPRDKNKVAEGKEEEEEIIERAMSPISELDLSRLNNIIPRDWIEWAWQIINDFRSCKCPDKVAKWERELLTIEAHGFIKGIEVSRRMNSGQEGSALHDDSFPEECVFLDDDARSHDGLVVEHKSSQFPMQSILSQEEEASWLNLMES